MKTVFEIFNVLISCNLNQTFKKAFICQLQKLNANGRESWRYLANSFFQRDSFTLTFATVELVVFLVPMLLRWNAIVRRSCVESLYGFTLSVGEIKRSVFPRGSVGTSGILLSSFGSNQGY